MFEDFKKFAIQIPITKKIKMLPYTINHLKIDMDLKVFPVAFVTLTALHKIF